MKTTDERPPLRRRELFLKALERTNLEERGAFLDGACGEDRRLREAVNELLAHHREDRFMEESPAGSAFTPDEPGPPQELFGDDTLGESIGRYKILQKVGEGGCGVVYMAEQEEPVRRRVALKVIKLGMDTRSVIARFEAERQALAMMDHPSIAKVFEAGATGSGRPYFVMELVRGVRITDYCDQHHLTTRERLDLFIRVCHAIQHAHQKGIIHRDIKPSNILVTLHDGVAVPKVIDFGIAKATTDQRLTDKTLFTALEQFVGTPAYMSPEQAEMSGLDIDTRCDIYSLGVLLYELLTGKTPFDTQELVSLGLDAMRRTIREQEPVRPSTRLSTMLDAELATTAENRQSESLKLIHLLRGDVDWIVMKCLEKNRARRYETANGLANDIQRHLNNEPVLARPPSATYRFQKLVRRNKLLFAAGIAVASALVLGLIVSAWLAVRARRSEKSEAKHREAAEEARKNEAQLRSRAEAQELAARHRAYASDINLTQQALAINNLGRAQELLNRQRPNPGEPELRGWEWRYLWRQCRSDALVTFCQRTNEISSLAASADGKWLALGEGNRLSIWDLKTEREMVSLPAGDGQVVSEGEVHAAFSSRDSLLAFSVAIRRSSTNWQNSVRLWNSVTQKVVAELTTPGPCLGLVFSGDGRTLVTCHGGDKGQIVVWQMPDGKKLASYSAQQDTFVWTAFAAVPDMNIAAHRMLGEAKVRVIDLTNGQERWSAKAADEGVMALALSSDGKFLASGAGFTESAIRLWNCASGLEINRLHGHRSFISALKFFPDSKTLASASGDQTIRLWDLSNPTNVPPPRVLRGHKLEIFHLALSSDNATLVSGCKDGSVCFWDTTSSQPQSARITVPGEFSSWRFDSESKSVVTVSRRGSVVRRKGPTFQEIEPLIDIGPDLNVLISIDTRWLAAGSKEGNLRVWDLQRTALLQEWTNGISPEPFAFLSDGKRLITVDRVDGICREWDLTNWKEIKSWRGAPELAGSYNSTVSPDERWCFTLNDGGIGSIKDIATGHERNLNLNVKEVFQLAFSPDGKLFSAASGFGMARLWKIPTLQEVATLRGVLLGVHSIAFSPDNKRLAFGSSGLEAIKLWDIESSHELLTLEGEGSVFLSTAFSPDGNVLGSMNEKGVLHLWRAPSWAEIAAAEAEEKRKSKRP